MLANITTFNVTWLLLYRKYNLINRMLWDINQCHTVCLYE